MDVVKLSDGLVQITRDDGQYLGITTGIGKKTFHLSRISERRNSSGYFIHGNIIEDWEINGFSEHDGSIFLIGRYIPGTPLSRTILSGSRDDLERIRQLAEAFVLLADRGIQSFHMYTNGILFTESGGMLFLPHQVMDTVNKHHPLPYRMKYFEQYNHPDLKNKENISFSLGVCSYRLLTGQFPFSSEDESELHDLMRAGTIVAPSYIKPEIRPEISDFIMKALLPSEDTRPSLQEWSCALKDWLENGIERQLTENEKATFLKQAEEIRNKHSKAAVRRTFFRKNGMRIAVLSGIFLLISGIAGSIIGNILKPRSTLGFTPEEVVHAFYTGLNTLDHETMADCVTGDAGKAYINEAVNYYVITRMRYSVEGGTGFIPATVWDESGRKKPPAGNSIFGVLNLTVNPLESPVPEEKAFTVRYELWRPVQSGDMEPDTVSLSGGTFIEEKLFLKMDKGTWVIYRMETIKEEPSGIIESESTVRYQ